MGVFEKNQEGLVYIVDNTHLQKLVFKWGHFKSEK